MQRGHPLVADDALGFDVTETTVRWRCRCRSGCACGPSRRCARPAGHRGRGSRAEGSCRSRRSSSSTRTTTTDAPELEPVAAADAFGALMPQAYCFSLEEGKEALVEAYLALTRRRAGVAARLSAADRPARRGGGCRSRGCSARERRASAGCVGLAPRRPHGLLAGGAAAPEAGRFARPARAPGGLAAAAPARPGARGADRAHRRRGCGGRRTGRASSGALRSTGSSASPARRRSSRSGSRRRMAR